MFQIKEAKKADVLSCVKGTVKEVTSPVYRDIRIREVVKKEPLKENLKVQVPDMAHIVEGGSQTGHVKLLDCNYKDMDSDITINELFGKIGGK